MGMIKEFKEFAMRGNVIDMAVGIIIGGAFGKIVSSIINDVIMPPIGLLLGGVDFKDLKLVLSSAKPAIMEGENVLAEAVAEVSINYGIFVNTVIDFIVIALAVFVMVKAINSLKRKEAEPEIAPAAAEPSKEELLLTEIRDLLKNK